MIAIHMKSSLYHSTYWEILQESYYNMVTDAYKVQTRAQANAPTIVNVPPVVQRATTKTIKLPIKREKGKDIEILPSGAVQPSQEALYCLQDLYYNHLSYHQVLGHHQSLQTLIRLMQVQI